MSVQRAIKFGRLLFQFPVAVNLHVRQPLQYLVEHNMFLNRAT